MKTTINCEKLFSFPPLFRSVATLSCEIEMFNYSTLDVVKTV